MAFAAIMLKPGATYAIDPEAHATATNVTAAGAMLYTFTVRYTDDGEINATSLSDENVRVTGPGGFDEMGGGFLE